LVICKFSQISCKFEFHEGEYYLGVKVFNMLPPYMKTESDNLEKFKSILQKILYKDSVYSLREYFEL